MQDRLVPPLIWPFRVVVLQGEMISHTVLRFLAHAGSLLTRRPASERRPAA